MGIGEKVLQARLEAGLSQRQLCGEEITRNMLSQIEHGKARPSVATLQYLAYRLEKPISFFMDEETVYSPNRQIVEDARRAYICEDFAFALECLKAYREPDPVFDWEADVLRAVSLLAMAEQAITEKKYLYARELLLTEISEHSLLEYFEPKRLLLLGRLPDANLTEICSKLPNMDEHLILRAGAALREGNPIRGGILLDAAENREDPRWNLLRAKCFLEAHQFEQAAKCFLIAEQENPLEALKGLERCYRELGNFERAYFYACRIREL